jgi:hypothetical protein
LSDIRKKIRLSEEKKIFYSSLNEIFDFFNKTEESLGVAVVHSVTHFILKKLEVSKEIYEDLDFIHEKIDSINTAIEIMGYDKTLTVKKNAFILHLASQIKMKIKSVLFMYLKNFNETDTSNFVENKDDAPVTATFMELKLVLQRKKKLEKAEHSEKREKEKKLKDAQDAKNLLKKIDELSR